MIMKWFSCQFWNGTPLSFLSQYYQISRMQAKAWLCGVFLWEENEWCHQEFLMQFCLFINDIKGLFLWTIRNQIIRNNLFTSSLWFDGSWYEWKMQSWTRLWWLLLSFTGDSDYHFYFLICTFTRCKCIFLHTADHFDTAELISES